MRRRRRLLEVEMNSAVDCIVRGPGAGEILFGLTGRRQVYSAVRRGYSVQEKTARDAVAVAERLSYDVSVTGPRSAPVRVVRDVPPAVEPVDLVEAEEPLW